MRCAITVMVVLGLAAAAPGVAQARSKDMPARARVDVRVYDLSAGAVAKADAAMLPVADQTVALRAAAGVLAAAGIDVQWLLCLDASPQCDAPLDPDELSVRFVRLPGAPARGQLQLGYSLIDTRAAAGQLATLYVDRVHWLVAQTRADAAVVLGFAVAHEIGHLLLGTNAHGAAGIMRAVWSRQDLDRTRDGDWVFSRGEASRMRSSIAQRKGLRSSQHNATGCLVSDGDHPDAAAGCRSAASASAAALRGVAPGADR